MIIKKIKPIILDYCKDTKHNWWQWHIESVVEYSKMLADKFEADKEILEISAWLHDI